MPGPRPKTDAQRQRRNAPKKPATGRSVIPAGVAQLPVPPPEPTPRWIASVQEDWLAVWSHPVMAAVDRTLHERQLRRLFDLYHQREILTAIVEAQPVVDGSQGQERPNPMWARLGQVESELLALEDRNGLNPKALADLGITFAASKKSLAELAEGLTDDGSEDGQSGEEEDPRYVIEVGGTETPRGSRTRKA